MEWLLLIAGGAIFVFLFVSSSKMRGDVDALQREQQIVGSEVKRLTSIYESLLAARHAPAAAAAAATGPAAATVIAPPATPLSPEPEAPPPPPVAEEPPAAPAAPQPPLETAAAVEPPAPPAPPPPQPDLPPGDIPPPPREAPAWPAAAPSADAPVAPSRRFEWERFVGVQLPIWIGAVALCIAGYFFVTYAIESGFFTPEFRVLAGAAAGLGFLAAGEFVRRRARNTNSASIAAALASAAIATFYATAYIASVVYSVIPEALGFVAMVAATVLAIVIALAFGQVVAIVGLLGGYITPALFHSDAPSALFLFGYLLAVHIAMFAIIRYRNWWHLSILALVGPLAWIGLWSGVPFFETQPIPAAAFLVLVPVVVALASWDAWRNDDTPMWLSQGVGGWQHRALPLATGLAALGFLAFLQQAENTFAFWQGLIALSILTVTGGFARPVALSRLQFLPLIAAVIGLVVWDRADTTAIATATAILAVVHGFGALDQLRRLRQPALWATALSFVVLAFFLIALFRIAGWELALAGKHFWAVSALALAAAMMAVLWTFGPRVADEQERSRVYAALAGAVTSLVSLAIVLELDPVLFPAASALAVLGLAAVHTRVPVRGLRILAAIYAMVFGILALGAGSYATVSARASGLEFVFAKSLSEAPFVLLILPGFAFFAASTLFRRTPRADGKPDVLAECLDVASVAALAIGLYYQLAPDYWWAGEARSHIVSAWLNGPLAIVAGVAVVIGLRLARRALYISGLVLSAALGLAIILRLLVPLVTFWPFVELPGIGPFDVAWLSLGLPAVIYLVTGRFVGERNQNLRWAFAVFGVVLLYALLLLQIRHAFHPDMTVQGVTGSAEFYTYSAATLLFGIALLVIGFIFQNRRARALSLVFVLAATLKVFLFDASGLEGLWRVLSFLGMGLCFLGISWAYARYVFGIGRGKPPAASAPPPVSPQPA